MTTTRDVVAGANDKQSQAVRRRRPVNPSNGNSPVSPLDDQGDQGGGPPQPGEEKPAFPHADLAKLDDTINRPDWEVPLLPMEDLLKAAIDLSKKGLDVKFEACQMFFQDGLTTSFSKILTDESINGWQLVDHKWILDNTHLLVELCVAKLSHDSFPLLKLLAMATDPDSEFHLFNKLRTCNSDKPFARPRDPREPKGWLVDLLNKFGMLNGFQMLHDRFTSGQALNIQIIAALLKPFGQCSKFLTPQTLKRYFLPIIEMVPQFLENLTDDELRKETQNNEAKNDALSVIIKCLRNLASQVPGQEETVKNLKMIRLNIIYRLLQISSFNGKMNALNEVNQVISSVNSSVCYDPQCYLNHNPEDDWLTAKDMTEWIQQNNILSIVLSDSLHQPQYVEKLENILRFIIQEKALTTQDLDNIWAAQAGKHEAIVKNVHNLLATLVWHFTPEQLDHLFDCFKASWTNASKKQHEKLLELIRRLAEYDKVGMMAQKVLNLLWNLAHSNDVPLDIMDQALRAHIRILESNLSSDREIQKIQWLDRFIEKLHTTDKWVIPALKQIRAICSLFGESPQRFNPYQRSIFYRHDLINQLQNNHALVTLVAKNLSTYIQTARQFSKAEQAEVDPHTVMAGSRYSHVQEVQGRLDFLSFLLKDGLLWLYAPEAKKIWKCLTENAVYLSDREACFKWYSRLMGDLQDLYTDITKDFFENNILQLDPSLLTENGMKCFERFFLSVNRMERKLVVKPDGAYLIDDLELIGLDYLWTVVIQVSNDIASRAIDLLKEIYTNLGPKLQVNQVEIHEHFIRSCFDRLKATYDTLCILDRDQDSTHKEATHMVRVLTVLMEYINKCDSDYHSERTILPMSRAFWGKDIKLYVRLPDQPVLQMWTQTNKTIGSVRRDVLAHIKANDTHSKIELNIGRESVSPADDRKLIGQLYFEGSKVTAKVTQVNASITSTTDSSFSGYPGKRYSDVPYPDVESSLPSVIMSLHLHYISFLWQVADLGCTLDMPLIRDCAQELMKLMPHDNTTVENLHAVCLDHAKLSEKSLIPTLDSCFFGNMPSKVLYLIEVVYTLLMPASELGGDASNFQYNFLKSGGLPLVLSMFTRNSFPPSADMETQRGIYLNALKVAKLLLTAIGFVLQKALVNIPNPNSERRLREVASHLAKQISNDNFFQSSKYIPDICTIQTLQKIVWASGCGTLQLIFSSNEEISKIYEMMIVELDEEDEQVCFQALEVMNLCLAFMPTALDTLSKEKSWQTFIIDMLLHCPSKSVRQMAQEQFFHMATSCGMGNQPLLSFITLLFNVLGSSAKECGKRAGNYFILLQRLLKYACNYKINLPNAEVLLNDEIDWLKRIRDEVKRTGETGVEDTILEGHINVTKELLAFQTSEKKYNIGCENGANLIKDLIDDFIFPVSKDYLQYRNRNFHAEQAIPVCSSSASINAGFELLVALTIGCPRNLKQVAGALHNLECEELKEWEYLPPIGPRPNKGFVGLKNAGATCYMNSVIQQLFMIPPIRNGILALESTGTNVVNNTHDEAFGYHHKPSGKSEDRRRYNIDVLQHLQVIFGHLAASKQQYFVPADFLNHFRLWGERVNPKEQHDALEFFNSLVDSLDEALKAFGHPALLSQVMGGSFADQKICQGCPHRYECEESFTTLNVDVRNHRNLLDSMEQYVKGDLLEGANAYHCEKCDKKVDTVKRLLIKKLPPVLAIQLKRFDYDWERECAIKFNDYFEFPRELDMGPYTVTGVAELEENQVIQQNKSSEPTPPISSKYRLVGVLVHSGQASGGHYYSYITQRDGGECNRWYKFDDGNVTECKMDDEDMKDMCFGGSYMGTLGEVCRWWSAYILFYERVDSLDVEMIKHIKELTLSSSKLHLVKMPYRIEYRVRKENGQFIHRQRRYSLEYFQFIKKLLTCNSVYLNPPSGKDILPEAEEIAMISVKLAARFLFSRGFRTKMVVRSHASEWYESVLFPLLRHSKNVRYWFVENVLLDNSNLSEYLLECPSDDVREVFTKLIIYVAHISLDCPRSSLTTSPGPWAQGGNNLSLSDQLLTDVLNLLNKEGSEHGRHSRLFKLFEGYANQGLVEKEQLLKLSVPTRFMSMPYCQCAGRYTVVSQLVRCCDVSSRTQSSESNLPLPNPYSNTNPAALLMPIQPKLAEMLFAGAVYVTKIIEGYRKMEGYGNSINSNEEMVKLLCFGCWENQQFSSTVLSVLLQKVAYIYSNSFELNLTNKMHLLLRILQIGDSWQSHRICDVLKGIPNDRHGLFDIIQLDKNLYKKQTYECIKHMVSLFDECDVAHQILKSNDDLKCKWKLAVEWLKDELETRPYTATSQCTYGDYYHSSDDNTLLLAKACKLCPEEEEESDDLGSN